MMEDIEKLTWSRAVVPRDAASLDIELIGAGDASQKIACSGCYVRFLKRDGTYSCQLLIAKSKIVEEGVSLPRAELKAAALNTHTTEVVKRALKERIVKSTYILDSEIALHWIAARVKPLKPWVRNRVVEISRFTEVDQWFHIKSEDIPVDIGTRKGASIDDVTDVSEWISGKPWMKKPMNELYNNNLLKNVNDVKLKQDQESVVRKEQIKGYDLCNPDAYLVTQDVAADSFTAITALTVQDNNPKLSSIIKERLQFSRFLVDIYRFRFRTIVRIMAIVIKVAETWISCINRRLVRFEIKDTNSNESYFSFSLSIMPSISKDKVAKDKLVSITLSDNDLKRAMRYFFLKATEELKSFVHPKFYRDISHETGGIIYYTGRVNNQDISIEGEFSKKMVDLTERSFIVPIVDSNSPLAFAIVSEIHWHDPVAMHCGVETTLRTLMSVAHILQARRIVKLFRHNCKRCRYLLKKTVEITMGPASKDQLCVALPFYITQTDLSGPYSSFSTHNKCTSVKIWIAVFVCSTTGTTSLKVMQGYDTFQFLLAFSRFACELGYPKKILADEGSQIVSGCESLVPNMVDIKGCLSREYGINFVTCPVGGHNYHGRVERKIRTIKETINKSLQNHRLSVLEWETLCAEVSNTMNNLPIAVGNKVEDLESLDLITPNRLRLARNNTRSPIGALEVTGKVERILNLKTSAYQAWWEAWLTSALPALVPKPKWFKSQKDVQKGDIILFNKSEGSLIGEYRYGIIEQVNFSSDGKVRSAVVRYRNANENMNRTTIRAVRTLIVIHRVDEIDLMEELGEAALAANAYFSLEFSP